MFFIYFAHYKSARLPSKRIRSGFFILLNERNISLGENIRFIQISNGCDLIFYVIINATLTQITVYLLHKTTLFNEAILLNFGYVVPSTL